MLGLLGIALGALMPARRLAALSPRCDQRWSTFGIALFMTALVVVAMMAWAYSQALVQDWESLALSWTLTIAVVFIGVVCGLVITVFREEWTLWRLSGSPEGSTHEFLPIVMANVLTIGLVALDAAAMILPQRLAGSNFLGALLQTAVAV